MSAPISEWPQRLGFQLDRAHVVACDFLGGSSEGQSSVSLLRGQPDCVRPRSFAAAVLTATRSSRVTISSSTCAGMF